MKLELNDSEIIYLFHRHQPKTAEAIENLGIKLEYLNKGMDRIVYSLGEKLVVKIENISHQTVKEINAVENMYNSAMAGLLLYVPPFYYADRINGIILTRRYNKPIEYNREFETKILPIADALSHFGVGDLHYNNIMLDDDNEPVAVDLGFYYKRL